ncbi:hypothetical protein OPV22_027035 [Ensete ventricosum]|uniref:Uncharacterized protein n=1 Tax=Ensete ventricosum TaxID=4639 RepID=A0AAV8PU48_ENSVE|nr:hypothetical protein OPV22_027035 [Ensete ventricosum]
MDSKAATVRTPKLMTNRLLSRKQFGFNFWSLTCFTREEQMSPSAESKEKLAKLYEVKGPNTVFDLIYDMVENAKKYEPKYRLIRNGLATKVEKSRNQVKQRKNRVKKVGGVKKTKAGDGAKAGKKK